MKPVTPRGQTPSARRDQHFRKELHRVVLDRHLRTRRRPADHVRAFSRPALLAGVVRRAIEKPAEVVPDRLLRHRQLLGPSVPDAEPPGDDGSPALRPALTTARAGAAAREGPFASAPRNRQMVGRYGGQAATGSRSRNRPGSSFSPRRAEASWSRCASSSIGTSGKNSPYSCSRLYVVLVES